MKSNASIHRVSAQLASRWKQFKQVSAPEATWVADLHRESGMEVGTCRQWIKRLNSPYPDIRQNTLYHYQELSDEARRLLIVYAYRRANDQNSNVCGGFVLVIVAGIIAAAVVGQMAAIAIVLLIAVITAFPIAFYVCRSGEQESARNLIDDS